MIEGAELVLKCESGGNPVPTVKWAKEGALLPSGDNVLEDAELVFPRLVPWGMFLWANKIIGYRLTDGRTGGQTDRWTDTLSYRVASSVLKTR